jgi:hypothetical protein
MRILATTYGPKHKKSLEVSTATPMKYENHKTETNFFRCRRGHFVSGQNYEESRIDCAKCNKKSHENYADLTNEYYKTDVLKSIV